jgi:hypothetical protein
MERERQRERNADASAERGGFHCVWTLRNFVPPPKKMKSDGVGRLLFGSALPPEVLACIVEFARDVVWGKRVDFRYAVCMAGAWRIYFASRLVAYRWPWAPGEFELMARRLRLPAAFVVPRRPTAAVTVRERVASWPECDWAYTEFASQRRAEPLPFGSDSDSDSFS